MKVTIPLLLSVFLLLLPATGQQVSVFTANYQTSAPVTQGNNVQLTFSVRLSNNSSSPLSGATLTLGNSANRNYARFTDVSPAVGGSVRLTQTVTVPQHEYAHWQNGGSPVLMLKYVDDNGKVAVAFIAAHILAPGQAM